MLRLSGGFISVLLATFLSVSGLCAQNIAYRFASGIDLVSIKEPILQFDLDNLGFMYFRTQNKIYISDPANSSSGIFAAIDIKQPVHTQFLSNNNGDIHFANIDEIPVQIYDIDGQLKVVLGEMKFEEESYQTIKQIFYDSRGYYVLATNSGKVIYFNSKGNFIYTINFEDDFKIIHLDNESNLYVLQHSLFSPEMEPKLEGLEEISKQEQYLKEEIQLLYAFLQENLVRQRSINNEFMSLKRKIKYIRSLHGKDNNLIVTEQARNEIKGLEQQSIELQKRQNKLARQYQEKQSERRKLSLELNKNFREKQAILVKAAENIFEENYKIKIYNNHGILKYSFNIPKPDVAAPLFNTYNVLSDSQKFFYGVPLNRDFEISSVLNPVSDFLLMAEGMGSQINVYDSNGIYLNRIEASPLFRKINSFRIDNQNNLFVLDLNFSRLRVFKPVKSSASSSLSTINY